MAHRSAAERGDVGPIIPPYTLQSMTSSHDNTANFLATQLPFHQTTGGGPLFDDGSNVINTGTGGWTGPSSSAAARGGGRRHQRSSQRYDSGGNGGVREDSYASHGEGAPTKDLTRLENEVRRTHTVIEALKMQTTRARDDAQVARAQHQRMENELRTLKVGK